MLSETLYKRNMTTNVNGSSDKCEQEKEPDDLQKVSDFFEANANAIERWLKEKAPDEVINQINAVISKHLVCEKEHRSSVTSELYQQWLSSSTMPLKVRRKIRFHIRAKREKKELSGNFLMSMKIELHSSNNIILCVINVVIYNSL